MDGLTSVLAVLAGILLRFGVPILVMIAAVYFLRRLDIRWQEEARQQLPKVPVYAPQIPCWEAKGCPPEKRQHCAEFLNPEIPCWQQFRGNDGQLKEDCLDCNVFHNAPVPVIAQ
jgi:hypothetical protein